MAGPAFTYGAPDAESPDPGLFGPGSVTWQLHSDPVSAVAGLRALLLQALHAETMAGFARRTDYRADPWGRLTRTAEYVAVVVFGTTTEVARTGAVVRRIHRALGVDDPHLLLWVHCTLVDSYLDVYRRSGAPLCDTEADAYVAEQTRAAAVVGLDPGAVPASVAELADYLASVRPQLHATREAREAARFLLLPPMPAKVRFLTPAVPAWATLAATGFAALPRWARREYGGTLLGPALAGVALPGLPVSDLSAGLALRAVRSTLGALPESMRVGPYQRAARARLGLDAAA